ncbi:MAG: hypothetical protein WC784_02890 [Candidatus Shapirobacteria bacterium]|jgi:hypothetical protein
MSPARIEKDGKLVCTVERGEIFSRVLNGTRYDIEGTDNGFKLKIGEINYFPQAFENTEILIERELLVKAVRTELK